MPSRLCRPNLCVVKMRAPDYLICAHWLSWHWLLPACTLFCFCAAIFLFLISSCGRFSFTMTNDLWCTMLHEFFFLVFFWQKGSCHKTITSPFWFMQNLFFMLPQCLFLQVNCTFLFFSYFFSGATCTSFWFKIMQMHFEFKCWQMSFDRCFENLCWNWSSIFCFRQVSLQQHSASRYAGYLRHVSTSWSRPSFFYWPFEKHCLYFGHSLVVINSIMFSFKAEALSKQAK